MESPQTQQTKESVWDESLGPFYDLNALAENVILTEDDFPIELFTEDDLVCYPVRQFFETQDGLSLSPGVSRVWKALSTHSLSVWTAASYIFGNIDAHGGLPRLEILKSPETPEEIIEHMVMEADQFARTFSHY